MGVAKCVLAFDSLCGAQTGVREHLLAFDSLRTGLVIVTSNVYIRKSERINFVRIIRYAHLF